jgi:hypothetical protein
MKGIKRLSIDDNAGFHAVNFRLWPAMTIHIPAATPSYCF